MLELFLASIKNMNSMVRKMKKRCLYEFHGSVSVNYVNTGHKRFFKHLLELQSLLEDKYELLLMPFSFRSILYKYHESCPTTPAWHLPEMLTVLCRTLKIAHRHH